MKKIIAIIGGGPAALMLAAQLNTNKFDVTIYERNAAVGRKFLVAGQGGFNLTHGESVDQLVTRYNPSSFLKNKIFSFSNTDLREWLSAIGIETFVGSSNRVFPVKGTKPIEVLNAILNSLSLKNVKVLTRHLWQGWNEKKDLVFSTEKEDSKIIKADYIVFALGGGSWQKTGSDGSWTTLFAAKGVKCNPFEASNCAFQINWPQEFIKQTEGKPIKNIAVKCLDKEKRGEIVVTSFGLEGGAVYALSPEIRQQLAANNSAIIYIDLKPDLPIEEIKRRLNYERGKKSWSKHLEDQLKFSKVQLTLLKSELTKEDFLNIDTLSSKIKKIPIQIIATAPVDEAISTVGGVSLDEIDTDFQLKKLPGHYAIGEMLDWDAPTGGYLLQACFSMGHSLAIRLNEL
ncbi:BaiN/RdsA family NAD(P)/FAD-dependent oxidoreductase [Solitalea koreensis]|uniref:TIGR03862 family flavoprotein n=1 Tax=Solitalea koreensis TaxID=543615 RepID=A0A521BA15_9SPHI|nr:TIGR03862 family flavoprotein [Solitalea koreensis]SMO43895.1 hypothetical protein SAMN06265350_10228 [Solitalea koreensis]